MSDSGAGERPTLLYPFCALCAWTTTPVSYICIFAGDRALWNTLHPASALCQRANPTLSRPYWNLCRILVSTSLSPPPPHLSELHPRLTAEIEETSLQNLPIYPSTNLQIFIYYLCFVIAHYDLVLNAPSPCQRIGSLVFHLIPDQPHSVACICQHYLPDHPTCLTQPRGTDRPILP